jgi:hypothetical protein
LEDLADFLASQGRVTEAQTQYDQVLDIVFMGGVKDWSSAPEMVAQQVSRFADRGELGETDDARRFYAQGLQWMAEHNPDDRTLGEMRTETERLLNAK